MLLSKTPIERDFLSAQHNREGNIIRVDGRGRQIAMSEHLADLQQ